MRVWMRSLTILGAVCGLVFGGGPGRADGPPDAAAIMRHMQEMNAKRHDEINAKIAELNIKPRTLETLPEQGVRIRKMIKSGDFAGAHRALADVLASSKLTPWTFYPFSGVAAWVPVAHDPDLEKRLDEWIAKSPTDPLPLIVRAHMYRYIAGSKRGEDFASKTPRSHLAAFADYSAKSLADIDAAIKLDPANPASYVLKLEMMSGRGFSEDLATAFTEAIAKYPNYFTLYETLLGALEPKWGGSTKAMYRFVDYYAGKTPDDSPFKMLYLFLYAHLLDDGQVSCLGELPDQDKVIRCIAAYMDANVTEDLKAKVATALKLYDHLDHEEFDNRLREVFLEMINVRDGIAYTRAMLEQAATAMHSDTEIENSMHHPGDYMIDELVAETNRDAPDIAIIKFNEALQDIDKTAFAQEEIKDRETSWIYDKLADLYDRRPPGKYSLQDNKVTAIVDETVARMLSKSTDHEDIPCNDYFIMNMHQDAIRACTEIIDYDDNVEARQMRGQTYIMSGKADLARSDLMIVAGSDSDQRVYAAMGIVQSYISQADFQSAVKTFEKYPVLFDPDASSTSFVATSYDNRCLAYMKIGELQKALDDCDAALKYLYLPDAAQRQQELQQRLSKH